MSEMKLQNLVADKINNDNILNPLTALPLGAESERQQLLDEFTADYCPEGAIQRELVYQLVDIVIRKRRLQLASCANVYKKQHNILANSYTATPLEYLLVFSNSDCPIDKEAENERLMQLDETQVKGEIAEYQATIKQVTGLIEQYADYQDLLTHLPEDIQTLWQKKLEESSWYEPTLEKLLYFINYKVVRYRQQQLMLLQRHQEIKMVTYGEFMKPNKIDMDLLYYEQFLDKKFEKILAMLLKLKTLTCNEVVKKTNATSIPDGSDETNEC